MQQQESARGASGAFRQLYLGQTVQLDPERTRGSVSRMYYRLDTEKERNAVQVWGGARRWRLPTVKGWPGPIVDVIRRFHSEPELLVKSCFANIPQTENYSV